MKGFGKLLKVIGTLAIIGGIIGFILLFIISKNALAGDFAGSWIKGAWQYIFSDTATWIGEQVTDAVGVVSTFTNVSPTIMQAAAFLVINYARLLLGGLAVSVIGTVFKKA